MTYLNLSQLYTNFGPDVDEGTMRAFMYDAKATGGRYLELAQVFEDTVAELNKTKEKLKSVTLELELNEPGRGTDEV